MDSYQCDDTAWSNYRRWSNSSSGSCSNSRCASKVYGRWSTGYGYKRKRRMDSLKIMNSKQIKISIIIPIYNAKKYISRCLDSLLNQTLRDIEIICVLDCPTDGTDTIVDEYARKDNRIVVLKNENNLHVAQSRNRGLDIARGDYVGFHDHDDYNCDAHMYEDLYRQAKNDDADVVFSNAILRFTRTDHKDEIWNFADTSKKALLSSNILPMLKSVNPQMLSHCVWSSIYRKDFLNQYELRFKDRHVYLDEDRLFNFEAFFKAQQISYVPKAYYVWEQLPESVSNNYPSYIAEAQITRTQYYVDYLKEHGAFEIYKKDLWTLLSQELKVYWSYYRILHHPNLVRFGVLMRNLEFPLMGYNYGLRIISKKRVKLTVFTVRARLLAWLKR